MLKFFLLLVVVYVVAAATPPFLEKASPEKQEEFKDLILSTTNLTDEEVETIVQRWISLQDKSIQNAFDDYKFQKEQQKIEQKKVHEEARKKFSPAAKEADNLLMAVANDPSLSVDAKTEKLDHIMTSLPSSVQIELQDAMRG